MTILMTRKHFILGVVYLDGSSIRDLSLRSLVVLVLGLIVVPGGRLYFSLAFETNLRSEDNLSEASIS